METTWGMRNEIAAALDSESRVGCLDPESRISRRMQEMVARVRVVWRPERRSPLWAVDFRNLMVRYRPRGGNPQAPRTLFRPWNSPSPRHKFLRKSWSFFFPHKFVGLLCIRQLCWWWDFVRFVVPCAFVCYSLSTKNCWVGWGRVE